MTSEYSDIFSRFMLKVTDYKLPNVDEDLVNEMIASWMHSTYSLPYVHRLFASFVIDDDVQEIEYKLKNPASEVEDQEFVEELFAEGLVMQWLRPQYRSVLNTHQILTNKEQNFYSQAPHAQQVGNIYKEAEIGLRKMIRDRDTFCNGYLIK